MGEWQDRQVGYGAICSAVFCATGVALIFVAIAGLVPDPCANLGNVLFMTGCLRTVLAVLRVKDRAINNAYELGRDAASLQLVRD